MQTHTSLKTTPFSETDEAHPPLAHEMASVGQKLRARVRELESNNKQNKLEEISIKHKHSEVQAAHKELEIRHQELKILANKQQSRANSYLQLFELAPTGYLSITAECVVKKANLSARCFLRSMGTQIIGKSLDEYLSADDMERLRHHLSTKVNTHLSGKIELTMQLPNGTLAPVSLLISNVHGTGSLERSYQVMMVDISEYIERDRRLRNAKEFLEEMALHDALTQLPNVTLFRDRLQQLIDHRYTNNGRIAVIYIDLDGFKPINDNLGHATGDIVLKEVSNKVRHMLNPGDTMARLGGDEFAVIMDNPADTQSALLYAQSIAAHIRDPIDINQTVVCISSSMGVCMFPEHAQSFDTLVKGADAAMYHAKQTGKDRVVLFSNESFDHIQRRSVLETTLPYAVSNQQLILHYRPVYCTRTRKIISLEALVCWQHPTCGMVMPDEFIPIAEKTEHIANIGDWIFDEACHQASTWKRMGLGTPISIPVSGRQLLKEDFFDKLQCRLQEHCLTQKSIELQITDNAVLIDHAHIKTKLQALSKAGHLITIDDFGTGCASLSRLINLPVSRIKIEQMLSGNQVSDPSLRTLTNSIVHMAHQLNVEVIVKGVELEEQVDFLIASQCNAMQGIWFSKDEDVKQITSKLQSGS